MLSRKWLLRLSLTALALLVTTDRRGPARPVRPPKPEPEPSPELEQPT